jgi:hypothetical protein
MWWQMKRRAVNGECAQFCHIKFPIAAHSVRKKKSIWQELTLSEISKHSCHLNALTRPKNGYIHRCGQGLQSGFAHKSAFLMAVILIAHTALEKIKINFSKSVYNRKKMLCYDTVKSNHEQRCS